MKLSLRVAVAVCAVTSLGCPQPMMMGTGGGGETGGGASTGGGGGATGGGAAQGGGGGTSSGDCTSLCASVAGQSCAAGCTTECTAKGAEAMALGCASSYSAFLTCAARPGNLSCSGSSLNAVNCQSETTALTTCLMAATSCQAVCARAATQASACTTGCEASCTATRMQANQLGCGNEFENNASCYATSTTPFTCSGTDLNPPSGCASRGMALGTCLANAMDAGTGGGGGFTGGGGGATGGGGGTTGGGGGGGGTPSGLSLCAAWAPQELLGEQLLTASGRNVQATVAVTGSDTVLAWYDGRDVHWREVLASGSTGASTDELDAGVVSSLSLVSRGAAAFGVYARQDTSLSDAQTLTHAFVSGGAWNAVATIGPDSSDEPAFAAGLDGQGTATLWRLWRPQGSAFTQLDEVTLSAGNVTNTRTLTDAGVALRLGLVGGVGVNRAVIFNDRVGPTLIATSASGDTAAMLPGGHDFVGAVSDDSSGIVVGATVPTDGGEVVTALAGMSATEDLGSVAVPGAGVFRSAAGALAGPGATGLVVWAEGRGVGVGTALYLSNYSGTAWSAPQLLTSTAAGPSYAFYRVTSTVGVITWADMNSANSMWLEVRVGASVGTPQPAPLNFTIQQLAGAPGRAVAVGTGPLFDGGTGVFAAHCR